jgi:hypothetical protein
MDQQVLYSPYQMPVHEPTDALLILSNAGAWTNTLLTLSNGGAWTYRCFTHLIK